jgi:predicted Ser/Thr protein kinase
LERESVDTSVRKKIGKYEILGVVGRGGMGVVYRAEDTLIGRPVAIKTLNESLDGQPEMLKRFYREAQAPLHPNIAIVFDVGAEDGKPFIVMEFIDGEGLDKLISSKRPLSLIEKLSVIEQVCTGLGFAHQCGVIHRDIKPANIMVKRNPIQAKIVDFGIASVQKAKFETGLTQTGTVIGSVHYISPERLKGEPFDGRSDIWATGVMLYQLLCGQLPFPGGQGEELAIMHKVIDEPHPPLSRWLLNYPPALDAIIDRALAKNPEERYSTAEELGADLRIVNEGLKKSHVEALFADAERLTTEGQFSSARDVLRQLTAIDPQHTGARQLLGIVNQHLTQLQRAEELRKLVAEAEAALAEANFTDALTLFDQAIKRDPANAELKAKLEAVKEAKRRHEEVSSLMTKADWLRERGDLTGALNLVEQALQLVPDDANARSAYLEITEQVKAAARQEQLRELISGARQEITSRQFTAAIELLKKAAEIDSAAPELDALMQSAMSGQEQERRRRILERIQAEIENCITQENYERAADLVDRALEQLPSEPSLLQLKTRVAVQSRKARVRRLVDATIAQAQETFLQAPGEALLIVQKALEELPGDERLLAFEDALRQRLKSAEKEEIRGRYLREAQSAIDRAEFEKAIEILESYQIEFADEAGVNQLLELARAELAQQQRSARIAACLSQVKPLLEAEQFDQAIHLLEAASTETGDASLQRLLAETREKQNELQRKTEAVLQRIVRLRERGQLDEALRLVEEQPSAASPGSPLHALKEEMGAEKRRREANANGIAAAAQAAERDDFTAAIEAIQAVQRAWGDSEDLTQALSEIESRRRQHATQAVAGAVEAARTALLANNAAAARDELRAVAPLVEFSASAQQAAWKRLKEEAAKAGASKSAGSAQAFEDFDVPAVQTRRFPALLLGGVALLAVAVVAVVFLLLRKPSGPPPAPPPPPSGTLVIQANADGADVYVDGELKGFTGADGRLTLLLDPGSHSVRVAKAGYAEAPAEKEIITQNRQTAMSVSLVRSSGPVTETTASLIINSTPGAKVAIDNVQKGTIDARGSLPLENIAPGTRLLSITLGGYQPFQQNLSLKPGDHRSIAAILTPNIAPSRPVQILSFTSSAAQIELGQSVTLQWQTANAAGVAIDNGVGPVIASGDITVSPQTTTTYTLSARGSNGTELRKVTVSVAKPQAQPPQILSFSATAMQIQQGQSTILQWKTANASEVFIDHDIGQVDPDGQTAVSPRTTTAYLLTARGNGGTQQRTVNVIVEQPAQPVQPAQSAVTPAPVVDEKALLAAVIANFNAALHAHNVARMQAIWTAMTARQGKDFQNLFKSYPEAAISDNCSPSALTVSGDSASWSCTETTRIDPKSAPHIQTIQVTFGKRNGAWTITDRR